MSDRDALDTSASVKGLGPTDRLPAELRPQGMIYKGIAFLPSLGLETVYNDNIYATKDDTVSDFITRFKPSLVLKKLYDGHSVGAGISGNIERFASERSENKEDMNAFVQGELIANTRWSFPFELNYDQKARPRIDPTRNQSPEEPATISTTSANLGVTHTFNRLIVKLLGRYKDKSFDDGISAQTGNPILYSAQDYSTAGGLLGLEYVFLRGRNSQRPEHSIYLNIAQDKQTYDTANTTLSDGSVVKSNSINQSILAGFKTSYKGIIFANIGAGIIRRDFDESELDTLQNLDLEADIAYSMTPKTTWRFNAQREMDQDSDFARGFLRSTYTLGLDYELYHNLYLQNELEYMTLNFEDQDSFDREDYTARMNLQYFLNPSWQAGAGVDYKTRKSDNELSEFDRLMIMLRLTKFF
ncbi:MAG: outer membrane beta-barrel protein [Alphaproteobacteria bacterium]|nr:outer membrane beta-barrel protein [Alphaproteobacteria bacterium]